MVKRSHLHRKILKYSLSLLLIGSPTITLAAEVEKQQSASLTECIEAAME